MAEEPSRKKRGADNQLTQHNWQDEEGGDENEEVCNFPPMRHSSPFMLRIILLCRLLFFFALRPRHRAAHRRKGHVVCCADRSASRCTSLYKIMLVERICTLGRKDLHLLLTLPRAQTCLLELCEWPPGPMCGFIRRMKVPGTWHTFS